MSKNAGKAGGTTYVALPEGSIDDPDAFADERTDEEIAFDEFRTGLGAEKMGELRVGKLKVGRDGSPLANARSAHCFSCPIDQFNFSELLEYVRTRHGAGLYRVVGIQAGKRGVQFNKIIEIAEDRGPARPAADSSAQNPASMMETLSRIMSDSQARTEALIARLSENRAPATPDPMTMMEKMATLFATIMGAAPKPVATAGDDLLGQLEKLAKIKDLLGGLGGGGDSDKESNFFDVVKAGLNSFGPALATLAARTMQQQPQEIPALSAPGSAGMPVAPAIISQHQKQPGPAPKAGDPAMASFKRQVDTLVQNAKNNVDPMQLAGTILDLTPDEKLDDLATMLEAPDMIEKMALLNSEVNQYRSFFEKLRDAILSLLEDSSPDTLPPNAGESAAGSSGAPTS